MTTYAVSRHQGAQEFLADAGFADAEVVAHFDTGMVRRGDLVVGTLPIPLIAEVCSAGGRYMHLDMRVPGEFRGQELTADQMRDFGAKLTEFRARRVKRGASRTGVGNAYRRIVGKKEE